VPAPGSSGGAARIDQKIFGVGWSQEPWFGIGSLSGVRGLFPRKSDETVDCSSGARQRQVTILGKRGSEPGRMVMGMGSDHENGDFR